MTEALPDFVRRDRPRCDPICPALQRKNIHTYEIFHADCVRFDRNVIYDQMIMGFQRCEECVLESPGDTP